MTKKHEADARQQVQKTTTSVPDERRRSLLRAGLGATLLPAGGSALLAACGGGGSDDAPAAPNTGSPAPQPPAGPQLASNFALAVLPDTQFYSRYATLAENDQFGRKFNSEPFQAQTNWVADNAKALNIPFLIHLGDVVDQQGKPEQWVVADQAMKVLESAKMPYSILAGNHDVILDLDYSGGPNNTGTDTERTLANEPYLKTFGTARASKPPSAAATRTASTSTTCSKPKGRSSWCSRCRGASPTTASRGHARYCATTRRCQPFSPTTS